LLDTIEEKVNKGYDANIYKERKIDYDNYGFE
jgi:hypothetical protein